jgi:hypothetical protein
VYTMDQPSPVICMYVWERCLTYSDPQIYLLWSLYIVLEVYTRTQRGS